MVFVADVPYKRALEVAVSVCDGIRLRTFKFKAIGVHLGSDEVEVD